MLLFLQNKYIRRELPFYFFSTLLFLPFYFFWAFPTLTECLWPAGHLGEERRVWDGLREGRPDAGARHVGQDGRRQAPDSPGQQDGRPHSQLERGEVSGRVVGVKAPKWERKGKRKKKKTRLFHDWDSGSSVEEINGGTQQKAATVSAIMCLNVSALTAPKFLETRYLTISSWNVSAVTLWCSRLNLKVQCVKS